MLTRVWAMMRKEFIQIGRDRRTLGMVLAQPVMLLLLFGYGINTVVDHLALIVFDESGDADSRALIAAFENSGYFDLVGFAISRAELADAIDAGTAKVALHIPPDFGDLVMRGQTGSVQLVVDGTDPNVASTASFAAAAVAQAQSAALTTALMERRGVGSSAAGIDLRPIVLYNPSMKSVNFMIPSIIALILLFQAVLLTAFAVVREREQGTLEQIIVTPIRTWEFMFGKILPYTVTAGIGGASSLIAARLIFGIEVAGSLPLLFLLSILFLLGSLGMGLFISTVSQTAGQATQMAMFLIMPSILLSGFMYPRESMPFIIRQLGLLTPMTYYLVILRGIMLKGVGLKVLLPWVVPLAIFSLIMFALSAWRFQKRIA